MSSYAPIVKENLSNTNNNFPQNIGRNASFSKQYSDRDLSYSDHSKSILSDSSSVFTNPNGTFRKPEHMKQTHSSFSSLPYAYISQNDLNLYKYQTYQNPLTNGMPPSHSTKPQTSQYLPKTMQINNGNSIGNYTSEPESNYDSDIGALSSKYTSLDRRRDDERR